MKKVTARIVFILSLLALSPVLPASNVSLTRASQTEWLYERADENDSPETLFESRVNLPVYGKTRFDVTSSVDQWIKRTPRSHPFLVHHQRTSSSDESEG